MKNTFKKITSVFLAMFILMSVSVTAFAAPGSGTPIGTEYEQYEYVLEKVDRYLEDKALDEENFEWTVSEENPLWVYRVLEDGTIRICTKALEKSAKLYNMTIPSSLDGYSVSELIGVDDWDQLSIIVPSCITEVEYNSFRNIKNLKRIVLPSTIKSIEVGALDSGTAMTSDEGLEIYYCGTEEQWKDVIVWNVPNAFGDKDYWAVTDFDWIANPYSGVSESYDSIPSYIKKVHFNVDPTTLEDLVPEEEPVEPTIWDKIAEAFQNFSDSIVVFFEKVANFFANLFA